MDRANHASLTRKELAILELLHTPIWVFDVQHLQMWWANRAALQLWNAEGQQELISRSFDDISAPTHMRLQNYLQRFQQGETIIENWTLYPKGEAKSVRCIASGVIIDGDRLAMLIEARIETPENQQISGDKHNNADIVLQSLNEKLEHRVAARTFELSQTNARLQDEIAKRQRVELVLRESEARFYKLVVNVPGMIYQYVQSIDGTSRFSYVSPGCQDIYEIAPEQAQEKAERLFNITHPDDVQRVRDSIAVSSAQLEPWQATYRIITQSGKLKWVQAISRPEAQPNGDIVWDGVLMDVSDRKQAEVDIEEALERERELNELKSSFISTVSHEFRTPLSIITTSVELLQHYSQSWTEEKKQQRFDRIYRAIEWMTKLLDDVLMIGKIEAGKLRFYPKPIDISKFCHHLIEELQSNLSLQQTLTLVQANSCSSLVNLDESLLNHILTNLLGNAIKYSPGVSNIQLELNCEPEYVQFRVKDTGIGISDADQTQLFSAFQRGSNVGTISGTGLGLAIVKQCVDLHGGTIHVNSEVGKGTHFTVTLPLQPHEV